MAYRSREADGEHRKHIKTEEDQQFQILLPQQKDEEEFVLQDVFAICVLQKKYLYPVLNGNDGKDSEKGDESAQQAALLKNDQTAGMESRSSRVS